MTIPVWDKFGHKSGRLFHLSISSEESPDTLEDLSQQRWGHTHHNPEQETSDRAAPLEAKAREPPTKTLVILKENVQV